MLAKRFFYVSAALFLLALTYHLGARSASAQAPANPIVAMCDFSGLPTAMTAGGDFYQASNDDGTSWTYRGNVFGQPVQAIPQTMGQIKDRYRK